MSQMYDIGPRIDFITKKGKLVVISFLNIFTSFHEMKTKIYIEILRHHSLHIYHKNKQ